MPYILLDILLLFVTWYIDEYKLKLANGTYSKTDKIAGVNNQKENFILNM
jgi:hypothetical protein